MKVFGLINIIRPSGPIESKGGGLVGALASMVVVLLLGVVAYRALEGALLGAQASAAAANVAIAWCAGAVLVVAAVVAGVWVLIGRRREVKQRPRVEALQAQIAASRVRAARTAIDQTRAAPLASPPPKRVEAVRVDRLEA